MGCEENNTIILQKLSNCPTKNPLQRDGTSQHQRMVQALESSSAPIHEFSLNEWMKFAYHYAEKVNFFSTISDDNPDGDWQRFFPEEEELQQMLQQFRRQTDDAATQPHLALFISFVLLLRSSQRQMNKITGRHLDFYYKKVLQLKKREAVADKVHLVFELAKNLAFFKLNDDALFDAGKDKKGLPLRYTITDGPVFNTAKVELLKSVYHQPGCTLRFAEVANSADGSGLPFKGDDFSWRAFGFANKKNQADEKENFSLPAAKPGFALASSILALKEGDRRITITLDLAFVPTDIDYSVFDKLQNNLTVLFTGEKDWIAPLRIVVTHENSTSSTKLVIETDIDGAEKAIIGYSSSIHKENYSTSLPIVRLLIDAEANKGYDVYEALTKATINNITIRVEVKGMKDLILENDDGRLDPAKPFLPFTPIPARGSNFYIGSSEVFSKKWKNIALNIAWKNKPDDLAAHYTAYRVGSLDENFTKNNYDVVVDADQKIRSGSLAEVGDENYFKVNFSYIKNGRWSDNDIDKNRSLFINSPFNIGEKYNSNQNPVSGQYVYAQQYSTGFSIFKQYLQSYLLNTYARPLFQMVKFKQGFSYTPPETGRLSVNTKDNFLRMTLVGKYGFFHKQYPQLFAAALTIPGAVIPKEPYTPMIESLTLDYDAEVKNDFDLDSKSNSQKLENYREQAIQFFHEAPFGQAEQHMFLKDQIPFPKKNKKIKPVPRYKTRGEFYIGLKNAIPETILPMLFQVAEGSENPDSPTFEKDKPIQWFALCNNEWKPLNEDFILADNTNNFLRPGLIKFLLPKEMNDDNNLLPSGYRWLRARLPNNVFPDSVCRFISVIAQVAEAEFYNEQNDLSHLKSGLAPNTISKMVDKQAAIKSISQPFGSFNGLPEETNKHFYIRVSERLRHKNRAVNIWDYERLVLEKFPSVYKVKCLNHTSSDFELAPGSVRIIPVPDVRNKNLFDLLKPKVSKNTLSEIENYLSSLNGFHVDCKAENPLYEEIQFKFEVKFHQQYDPKAYTQILKRDIKKFLAPWFDNEFSEIHFGGELYKSKAIRFIEDRPYVDFITEFQMVNATNGGNDTDKIVASCSRAILTSHKEHLIKPIQPPVC
jgi:hypothetical protein